MEGPLLRGWGTAFCFIRPMHANGWLWFKRFGRYVRCALFCRIFKNLKVILVWNWRLLKQVRIKSWGSWSVRWPHKWVTFIKGLPRPHRTNEWMRRTCAWHWAYRNGACKTIGILEYRRKVLLPGSGYSGDSGKRTNQKKIKVWRRLSQKIRKSLRN